MRKRKSFHLRLCVLSRLAPLKTLMDRTQVRRLGSERSGMKTDEGCTDEEAPGYSAALYTLSRSVCKRG